MVWSTANVTVTTWAPVSAPTNIRTWGDWASRTWGFLQSSTYSWDFLSQGYVYSTVDTPATTWSSVELPAIICIGDSITVGADDEDTYVWGYRDHLQDLLGKGTFRFLGSKTSPNPPDLDGYDNHHEGVSGNTTAQLKARFQAILDNYVDAASDNRYLLLIMIGINDGFAIPSATTAVDNVEDMIEMAHAHMPGADVYATLITPYNNVFLNPYVIAFNSQLAARVATLQTSLPKANLYTVNLYAAFTANCSPLSVCYFNDPTHPNDHGFQFIASAYAGAILTHFTP